MVPDEYDFWLLDLDGTLVDIQPSYVQQVFDEVGDRLGREFTDREAEIIWHGLGGSRNEQLSQWGIDVDRFWDVFHDVEDAEARARHTYLYDDADFVADLDVPVGLVTHCQQYLTDPVLDRLDIRDWFDTVVCCTEDTGWKPDPEPVEMAMEDLDIAYTGHAGAPPTGANGASEAPRSSGVLAGDGPHDVGAAWNAGLDGIHVERHGPDRRGQCVLGDYRIETFGEFADGLSEPGSD
nr:HAD family hydrolase [Halorientalis salina]